MKSSFFEFQVATTGLFTARGNLQVTSHNIANAETPGYSRQYAMQRTNTPLTFYNGKGMIGTGSEVYGVGQIRDFYLDKKYWSERCVLGEYNAKKTQLDVIESVFNDLSTGGLTDVFNDFFSKLQALAENSGNPTYRTSLIQSANSLISLVQLQANALRKQQQDINTEIKAVTERINSLGQQISSLNKQIATCEMDGATANDLRDARARLVDELSLYVNVEVTEKEMNADYAAGKFTDSDDQGKSDKRFTVLINGYEFVNHYTVQKLEVRAKNVYDAENPDDPNRAHNSMDTDGLYDIYFSNGVKFNMYSTTLKGELKGLIDIRDGNNTFTEIDGTSYNTTYKGIPHYLNRLNDLVRTFSRAINEGLDRDGNPIPGVIGHVEGSTNTEKPNTGYLFFTIKPMSPSDEEQKTGSIMDYSKMTVFNIGVNSEIMADPYKIAAAQNSGTRGNAESAARSYDKAVTALDYIVNTVGGSSRAQIVLDLANATKTAVDSLFNSADAKINDSPRRSLGNDDLKRAEAALNAAKAAEEAAKALYEAKKTILDQGQNVSFNSTDALANSSGVGEPTSAKNQEDFDDARDAVSDIISSGKSALDIALGAAANVADNAEAAYKAAKAEREAAQNVYNLVKTAVNLPAGQAKNDADDKALAAIEALKDMTEAGSSASQKAEDARDSDAAEQNDLNDLVTKMGTTSTDIMELSELMMDYGWETSDESDNNVILSLLKIKDYTHLFKEGKLSDFINAISTELGIDIKQATKFQSNYTDVTVTINNQRISVSGVDVNEEMINMIKYQQLYQAAAKLINIIDSIYDTTVNRLGAW